MEEENQEYSADNLAEDLIGPGSEIEQPVVPVEPAPEGEEVQPEVQQAFESYKELGIEFPEDFEIKGLNKQEFIEKAKEVKFPKQQDQADDDPFISNYREAKKAGLTYDDYIEQETQKRQFINSDADNGLKQVYQNMLNKEGERQYDDEAIEEHLSKLTKIEKDQQWDDIKGRLKESPVAKPEQETFKSKADKYNTETLSQVTDKISSDYQEELLGIPFGESDKKEFNQEFQKLLSIDAESEPKQFYNSPLLDVVNDTKTMYELMYLHKQLKDGGIKNIINNAKEKAIEEALSKAGLSQTRGKSGKEVSHLPEQNPDDFV